MFVHYICLSVGMFVHYICASCLQKPEGGTDSPETGVTMVVSHLIWVLETTPGTSAKQQVLLTSEPSVQPQLLMFFILTSYPFSYVLMIGEWPKAPEGNLEFYSREVEGMPRNPNSVERKQHNCSSKARPCTSANSKATELLRKERSPPSGQQT